MRSDASASQASRNAVGEIGKPPFGSRIPASRGVEDPRRCFDIARGPSPAEKPGYGIVWVPYVGFYPLGRPRVKKLWSDADAKAMAKHYAKEGVGEDLARRVYSSRLLGGEPRQPQDPGRHAQLLEGAEHVVPGEGTGDLRPPL